MSGNQTKTSGADGLHCVMVRDADAILKLESDWRALEAASPDTVLFQSFDWCANHLAFSKSDDAFAPVVFVVYQEKTPVALLPLCIQGKGRLTILTGFSEPFQHYTEILADASLVEALGHDRVSARLFETLAQCGADYVHFGQVREGGTLTRLLQGRADPSGEAVTTPFVSIEKFADFAAYEKTISSQLRADLQDTRERYERAGKLSHKSGSSVGLLDEVVDRIHAGNEIWLEQMGMTTRTFQNTDLEAFLKRIAAKGNSNKAVAISLVQNKTPFADLLGLAYCGRFYAYMMTWKTDHKAGDPHQMLLLEAIKTCFTKGFTTADFTIPVSDNILSPTDLMTSVRDYVLPLNIKGSAYTRLWLGFLRPLSKRIFFALPSGLRGKLLGSGAD